MYFDFGPKSTSLLIFFIHGLIFSIILLERAYREGRKSSYWLSAFIFLCAMYIVPFMCGYASWYSFEFYRNILFYIPFQQLFLLPPILYFYLKCQINDSYKFTKRDWLHFIPGILYLVYSLIIWITDHVVLNEYYFYEDGKDKDLALWYQVSGFIFMLVYMVMSVRLYQQFRKSTTEVVSYADSILFPWIHKFLTAFILLIIVRLLFFILNPEWWNFGRKYWYYLVFSILFYYISISGYVQTFKQEMANGRGLDLDKSLEDLLEESERTVLEEEEKEEKETTKPLIDDSLKQEIEELMTQEKVFRNPALTLFDIASLLNTHPKKISQSINQGFDMNFNDFVNQYRTREVIEKVNKEENQIKTLLGIALDAGFNSKSTFNRAFKKQTNLSPKEYFKQNGVK